ncbi:hypothetical protein COCCU_14325 (plasmid) [Corynebacterium occultum]|uniref:Uncharacterized protein n=1 Tax=Corynebacterium occultum TaxID=2675219 RepID=A0A6B8WBS0_9CORY|nr:hypothetical protein COCCU_14325 [Corynebacterium occultum]
MCYVVSTVGRWVLFHNDGGTAMAASTTENGRARGRQLAGQQIYHRLHPRPVSRALLQHNARDLADAVTTDQTTDKDCHARQDEAAVE